MTYSLIIWTVIAVNSSSYRQIYDWRPLAQFESQQLCEDAAKSLALTEPIRYRCVRTK